MNQDPQEREVDGLKAQQQLSYCKPGYHCVWDRDSLEDTFCRVDRNSFVDKTTSRVFETPEISNMVLRWIEVHGRIFKSRRVGYQIIAEYRGRRTVLLDTSDKMPRKYKTDDAQAICSGEKNILKVAIASILLAQTGGDIRRTYFEVFDRFGSDIFDSFPWPEGMLPPA